MIIAHTLNYRLENIMFYLDSASKVYICYNKLLFSTYNKEDSPLVHTINHAKLVCLGKGTVTLDILVKGKPKVINFCNVFYALDLEYNLILVGTIEKTGYSILVKKEK